MKELNPHCNQRPDLQLIFPGRKLLTNVVVCTALTLGSIAKDALMASKMQGRKQRKHARVAARLDAQLLNVSVEAQGGMASETFDSGAGDRRGGRAVQCGYVEQRLHRAPAQVAHG